MFEAKVSDSQFDFRQGLIAIEAIIATQVLVQNYYDLYMESIFREALEDTEKRIKVSSEWINNIRSA